MAKKKRMTQREKNDRAKARAELRAEGIIPPVKKRLNRKAFKKEALAEYEEFDKYSGLGALPSKMRNLHVALLSVVYNQTQQNISAEQIGACKVMKIAAALNKYDAENMNAGREYDYDEVIEKVVQPILEL